MALSMRGRIGRICRLGPMKISAFWTARGTWWRNRRRCRRCFAAMLRKGGVELLPVASDQNWGAASTQLVRRADGRACAGNHRARSRCGTSLGATGVEGICAGGGVERGQELTSTNVPWIFRLPATTTLPPRCGSSRRLRRRAGRIQSDFAMCWHQASDRWRGVSVDGRAEESNS